MDIYAKRWWVVGGGRKNIKSGPLSKKSELLFLLSGPLFFLCGLLVKLHKYTFPAFCLPAQV